MVGFFLGSMMFMGVRALDARGHGRTLTPVAMTWFLIMCVLTYKIGYGQWIGSSPLHHSIAVFPVVILVAMRVRPLSWLLSLRPLTFLGDISYSVYLVHVPLQMFVLAYCGWRKITIVTTEPTVLYQYAAAILALATITHYGIERPARSWIRRRLEEPRPRAEVGEPVPEAS